MKATRIESIEADGTTELSASMDGYRLWYRFPSQFSTASPGNTFLVAAILPAMVRGETLEIDPAFPVCPRLLANLNVIQDIFIAWGATLRVPFKRVKVVASEEIQPSESNEIGSFFSGGVDGTFTLLRHMEEVTSMVFVKGIDMQLTNDNLFNEVWEANSDFARTIGKPLVPVASNVRFFAREHGCVWPTYFGVGLASIAYALGLSKVFIASGVYYDDLAPHGSHPLTDPLLSSSTMQVVHDGADTQRIEKLRRIAEFPPAMKILRVCWQDKTFNCGKCEKCLRTRVQLRVLGIEAPTFAPLTDLSDVRKLDLWDDIEMAFLRESLALTIKGNDVPLQKALRTCTRRNEMRRFLGQTDELVLGGALRRMKKWVRGR